MEQDTNKMIEEQFKVLPEPLQRAIALMDWKKIVADISKGNNLSADEAKILETEAMLVMYGFASGDDLQFNIAHELSVEPGRAKMLSDEINLKVFSVILAKADQLSKETGTLQTAASVAPATETAPTPKVFEPKPATSNPPINVLPPKPKEEPLELLPPKTEPVKIDTIEPPKRTVNQAYPDGVDPYREPIK